ncbi:uncharacterized protein LOC142337519 isoform X2 [Convolutriloba macropyga]|uniref:uncharacterized protein LOC142337519 isoform X2 n=1 Tax=Convolutriloba macropyga TaxID=536237 RepID=UPI003F527087
MTDELKNMHVTWDQGLKEMTQNVKKLIDIQLTMQQRPVNPPVHQQTAVLQPAGQQMFIRNPMIVPGPQHQVPTLSQNPNPVVSGVYAPPGTQGQFLAPPQGSIAPTPGFQFRPPGAPPSMPNGMSFPTTSDVVPIPAQMPVPQNPSLFGQPVPQTVVRQPVQPVYPIKQVPPEGENFQATPNPMLSALLRAPNPHVEQKLNQPFQPPKMLSSVEHAQDSVPSSAKEPNPIPTLGASPNVLTSTPKVLGNKVAVIAAPKANVPGPVLPNAPSSLISQDGSSSVNSKKSLFSNIAAPKIDNVPPVSEQVPASTVTPQFSTLFGVKTTQSGQVPTTSSQLGFSFSSQLKPTGTSSTVPSSAFSFKMAPPVVTFATPASVFSPSTASNTISGQPSAAVFTGFKGFQAPVSNLSQPEAQNQAKSKTAFSLVGGAANSKPTSLLSEVPSKTSPQKSQDNKNETSMSNKGLGTLGSGSSFSFKFNMTAPPTAEIGKSPGKITNTPEKPSNTSGSALVVPGNGTTNSTTIASPGGNKEADDSTHDPQFEPIVHLDKVVDLKTGEESEIEMFCERAKLRRFVDGEWKERGVGDMKVLKSQSDSGKAEKYRVVMRREQVKKLCANHVITDEMTIQVHPTNDKSLIWIANDFAEEEEVLEKLCVRFKTADVAAKFKKVFEEGVTVYGKANSSEVKSFAKPETSEKQPVVKETPSVKENVSESRVKKGDASKSSDEKPKIEQEERKPKKETVVETIGPTESSNTNSLASKFGLKSGQWNCDACLTQNKADVNRCAACDGPKDPKAVGTTTIAPAVASDAFGGGSKGPVFKFDTSKTSAGAFKFGVSSNAQTSSFKFGVTPSVATKPEDKTANDEEKEKPSIFEGFKGFGLKSAATNSSTPLFGAPAFQPVSSSNVSHDLSKSSVITTTTASLFGTATENAKPTVANSIFGSQSSGTSSIFGSSSATLSTSGIFGKTAATEVSSNAAPAPESNSIFGKSAAPASNGIFGKSSGTAPVSSGGMVFGKGAGDGTGSKFGQSVFEKPRAELQTADDLTKEASEKCGVTFETEAEDDERYYCEEDDGEYEEGEGYYPGDEYYGDGEDEEYVYGDNYEEPEEGEIFGYDEEGQLTDLDHVQNTPMRMTAGRLGPSKPGQFMSPMARFDPNESAGTPPQVTSVFGTKPPALVNPIAKVPVASTAEDFEKLDDEINDDEKEEIDIVYERASDENPEHRSLVEQYRLPPLFYDSLSKPECSGCIGCDDDPNLTNRKIYKDDTTAKVTLKPEVESQRIAESGTSKEASQSLDASKTSGFLFGTQVQSGFSFAWLASNAADQGGAFGQGSSTGKSTTFTAKPLFAGLNLGGDTTSESTTNPIASENPEEQEECDIHFKPIVQLEKVDTKSGDEDSEIIFCERAKLFR